MPPVFPVGSEITVTKPEQTVPAIGPQWATVGVGLSHWVENCCAIVFRIDKLPETYSYSNPESLRNLLDRCPMYESATMLSDFRVLAAKESTWQFHFPYPRRDRRSTAHVV